jgi:hypothetical protein
MRAARHHRDIPGFFSSGDYQAVESIVRELPASGNLIEVGSLLGRSTTAWAEALRAAGKDFRILAIDSFTSVYRTYADALEGDPELIAQVLGPEHSQEALFADFTAPYPNISYVKARFSTSFVWNRPLHCVFEDSDHADATLREALPFWFGKLASGGILCGHDYHETSPDVIRNVHLIADKLGLPVGLYPDSSIWSIRKP